MISTCLIGRISRNPTKKTKKNDQMSFFTLFCIVLSSSLVDNKQFQKVLEQRVGNLRHVCALSLQLSKFKTSGFRSNRWSWLPLFFSTPAIWTMGMCSTSATRNRWLMTMLMVLYLTTSLLWSGKEKHCLLFLRKIVNKTTDSSIVLSKSFYKTKGGRE